VACGVLISWPGFEPMPLQWEHGALTSEGQWLFSPVEAISQTGTKGEEWVFWMQKLNDLRNVSDKDAMKSSPRLMHACVLLSRFSHVQLFATPWTIAHQAPLSMGFSRQEYWSGSPCPPPGDLPDTGIKPRSLALQEDSLPSEPPGKSLVFHKYFPNEEAEYFRT